MISIGVKYLPMVSITFDGLIEKINTIVKKIIEDHGGEVFADSKEGLGTIISFTLHKYYGED